MKTILLSMLVLGVTGGIFGALLAFASKIFHVDVDPKQEKVRAALAGANCGGCGYPGCDGYAAAVARGEAPTNRCVAGGAATAAAVAEIMGVTAGASEKMVAFVPCSGTEGHAEMRFNYTGPKDCRAAMLFGGKSNKTCTFACIGLGNCVKACKFDAMHIVDGIAKVGPILTKASGMPKTDDTLLCLSMLYYLHKVLKDNYQERLMEVPAVIEWSDAIQDSREWSDALSVRCKDEGSPENTPKNMRKAHKLKRSKRQEKSYRRAMNLIETKYGLMPYAVYNQISTLVEKVRKEVEEKKQETSPQPPVQPVNKLEEIRKKLRGE